MIDSDYGPINMTIRVHENNLLTKNQYDLMLNATNFTEALQILMNTDYNEYIDEEVNSTNYEDIFMRHLVSTYEWVLDQLTNDWLSEFLTLKYEYHNVKVIFKEELTDRDFGQTFIPIGKYPRYELRRAVTTGQSTVLPDYYISNINKLKAYYGDDPTINEIDVFMDDVYIDHLKFLAIQIDDLDINDYVELMIDLYNIDIFFRAKTNNRSRNHLFAVLSPGGSIPVEDYLKLTDLSFEQAVSGLQESKYGLLIEEAKTEERVLSLTKLEQLLDDAETEFLAQAKMKVFGPLPVVAYIHAVETEIKNIRLILGGHINQINSEVIRNRLRLNYAV